MTPVQHGEDFLLQVEDPGNPGTYIDVADMNSYSKSSNRDRTQYPVFGRPLPHSIKGARELTYSVSGFLTDDDPGQQALRDAEANDTDINIRVLFDGVNGFQQLVNVGTFTHDATPEGLQEHGFEFAAVNPATVVGTGPIV